MNELKTGFSKLPDNDLRTFGGSVHHALSTGDGLIYFATVDPSAADVLTATTNYPRKENRTTDHTDKHG